MSENFRLRLKNSFTSEIDVTGVIRLTFEVFFGWERSVSGSFPPRTFRLAKKEKRKNKEDRDNPDVTSVEDTLVPFVLLPEDLRFVLHLQGPSREKSVLKRDS